MRKSDQSFFQNTQCPWFPCHDGADEDSFNCLFCYCPLYPLGEACGGACAYTADGIKDCSGCQLPHREGGYEYVLSKFPCLAELARREKKEDPD